MSDLITSAAPEAPREAAATRVCDNCGAPLLGRYCHSCGQSGKNPLLHFGQALEEILDSFWHLDGRIFCTLRDLWVPGRVALNYLTGQRVKYVQPLRLFVILSLITFFVANFAMTVNGDLVQMDNDNNMFADADSVAEVESRRDAALADLRKARADLGKKLPGVGAGFDAGIERTQRLAEERIRALRAEGKPGVSTPAPTQAAAGAAVDAGAVKADKIEADAAKTETRTADADLADDRKASNAITADPQQSPESEPDDKLDSKVRISAGENATDWDIENDPVAIAWLPEFANEWLTIQARHGFANANRINTDPKAFVNALLKTVPTMLFLLVPVFALLLKVFYFFARRTYLEHLVVALYSHCWLLLSLLAIFISMIVRHASSNSGISVALGTFEGLLWFAMPIYLLIMQKRVYQQGWLLTLAKYFTIGTIYFVMLTFGALFTFFIGLIRM